MQISGASSQYCLDGQRLILVSGTLGGNAEFRTEIDGFSRVQSFGTNTAKGPDRWEVRTKDGLILTYGNTTDSTLEAQGRSPVVVLSWMVNRVEDRRGNFYTLAYDKVAASGEIYPSVIRYTGNTASNITPYNAIRFDYGGVTPPVRPDPQDGYVAGSRVSVQRRLAKVTVLIDTAADGTGDNVAHEYRIGYELNATNGRSLVRQVEHCTRNPQTSVTECLPATVFGYQQRSTGQANFAAAGSGVWAGPVTGMPSIYTNPVITSFREAQGQLRSSAVFADFNGDGRLDHGYSSGSGTWRICLSTGSGFACSDWTAPGVSSTALVGDFDGDGRSDVMIPPIAGIGATGTLNVCRSTGTAFNCQGWSGWVRGDASLSAYLYRLLDFNGDGRMDYVLAESSTQMRRCLSNGSSFDCAIVSGNIDDIYPEPPGDVPSEVLTTAWQADVNGDGRDDFIRMDSSTTPGVLTVRQCITGESGITCSNAGSTVGAYGYVATPAAGAQFTAAIGGDGAEPYADFVLPRSGGPAATNGEICRGTGSGITCRAVTVADSADLRFSAVADFDGDGRPDTLAFHPTRKVWRLCQLGASTTLSCADWAGPDVTISNSTRLLDWRVGDFNGDGRMDIATYDRVADQWTVHLANGVVPDLLLSVTNGVGEQTQVSYSSLQDSAAYTRDSAATYPQRNLQDGSPVVRQVRRDNGIGGVLATDYSYGGARVDLSGRGFLGFRWFAANDNASRVTTTTELSQAFPTIGMPTLISATHANGREISRVTNVLASSVTANPTSVPKAYFRYISRSVTVTRELNDATNAVVSTVTADPIRYDAYGNEDFRTTTRVAGGQTFTETVSATYDNNVTAWLLGRPSQVSVTSSAPGYPSVTRTRNMTYTTQGELATEIVENTGTPDVKLTTTLTRHAFTGAITNRSIAWTELNTSTAGWTDDNTGRTRSVETLAYDTRYRFVTQVTNALNQSETRELDPRTGQMTALTGPNAITTRWRYDGWGRQVQETRADNTYSTTRYTQCTSGCGLARVLVTRQSFNGSNQQISVPAVSYLDALGRTIRWQSWAFDGRERNGERQFDANGRMVNKTRTRFATDPAAQTTYRYDDLGRMTEVNDPTTGVSTITHNGLTTTFVNSKKQTRTEVRNALGSLRTVTDARGKVTTYDYAPFGLLGSVTDAQGNVIRITYDRLGRRTRVQDPNLGTWNYVVNALGEVRSQTDAKSQVLKFRYDALGRLIHRVGPGVDHQWVFDTATKGIGKLAEATTRTGTGTVDYRRLHAYDSLGRPQRTTVRLDLDFVTESVYDSNGRVSRVNHTRRTVGATTGGQTVGVDYAYTGNGYLGQMRRDDGAILWTVNEQDALDRVRRQTHGNGVVTQRSFHATRGLLETIVAGPLASGQPDASAQNDAYSYDSLGNLSSRAQHNGAGGLLTETFDYDELNRMTRSQVAGRPEVLIGYNDIGNITSKTGVGTYAYPASGASAVRPQAVTSITGTVAGITNPTFGYDANGNLTSGLGRTVTWTSFNYPSRISKATGAGPGSAGTGSVVNDFVYGPEYQRVRQTITVTGGPTPGTTVHTYAGAIERETRSADNTTHVRTFLPQGVVLIDRYTSSTANVTNAPAQRQIRYYQKDRLGSTVAVLNESGAVLERQFYDPWGKRRNGDGTGSDSMRSLDHRYGYTEHEMLDAVGLIHMGGRVYDPLLGRFMSADPTVPDPADGQNFNRYTYVLNSPLNYTDPSGFAQVRTMESGTGVSGDDWIKYLLDRMFITEQEMQQEEDLELMRWTASIVENGGVVTHHHLFSFGQLSARHGMRRLHFARIRAIAESMRSAQLVAQKAVDDAIKAAANALNDADAKASRPYMQPELAEADQPTLVQVGAGLVGTLRAMGSGRRRAIPFATAPGEQGGGDQTRLYVTYVKFGPDGEIYIGRTSGFGTPGEIVAARDLRHIILNSMGFSAAVWDKAASGAGGYDAIRGREQQGIDFHGGVGSPSVANLINAISPFNPFYMHYMFSAWEMFGEYRPTYRWPR